MPPKWAKTSKPEDEQEKCGLYAEILHKAHINPRHKRNQVLAIALHNNMFTILFLVLHKGKGPLWWPHLNVQELKFGRWSAQIDPQSIEHRCLEYCYTSCGPPQSIQHRCLAYHYTHC